MVLYNLDRSLLMRLTCGRCSAGLVPAWTGLKCPRGNACGRGGLEETAKLLAALRAAEQTADLARV